MLIVSIILIVVIVLSAIMLECAWNNRFRWPIQSNGGLAILAIVLMAASLFTLAIMGIKQRMDANAKKQSHTHLQAPHIGGAFYSNTLSRRSFFPAAMSFIYSIPARKSDRS